MCTNQLLTCVKHLFKGDSDIEVRTYTNGQERCDTSFLTPCALLFSLNHDFLLVLDDYATGAGCYGRALQCVGTVAGHRHYAG